jgi:integrase
MYKHSTQKNHTHILTKHLLPRFGDTVLSDLSRQHVQTYVAHLVRKGYAPRTVDHIHDVLSAVLRTAVKWGHLPHNPAHDVDLPALKTVRPKWALSETQASALLDKLPALAKTMVGVALLTGLRRGELFALRWKDIGEGDTVLSVREAVYEGHFDAPKTAAGLRRVPLSPAAGALLTDWRRRARRSEPEDLVFVVWQADLAQ